MIYAIGPIGIPIVTGPGAISGGNGMWRQTLKGMQQQFLLFVSIIIVLLLTLIVFLTAPKYLKGWASQELD